MSLQAFAKALSDFQADLPAVGKDQTAKVKTKQGGEYSYSYTDLATIALAALPLLAKHGLSFTAQPTMSEFGFVLKYSLLHAEGHREDGHYPLPDPAQHGAQEIGSAITYARRYSLCSVTGIAPGSDDDDGQAAVNTRSAQPRVSAPSNGIPGPDDMQSVRARIWAARPGGWSQKDVEQDFADQTDGNFATAAIDALVGYAEHLEHKLRESA